MWSFAHGYSINLKEVVNFCDNNGLWIIGDSEPQTLYRYCANKSITVEVIGNIHDNPELLEEEKEVESETVDTDNIICPYCGNPYSNSTIIIHDTITHSSSKQRCNICSEVFLLKEMKTFKTFKIEKGD